ncbi:molybdate ABC transporter permease subunit [Catenovulum sp. SM1970]|uniref:molybdate ABC transporter permease subunit n=1 Tax=Marinifaba aquimaris TaxID=2741323 RepID=UPI001572DD87|nr:molybdate ABC transporter permease subunit [Marinifaba aquimaris]
MFTQAEWAAIFLSLKLSLYTTAILLVIGVPLAWYLARYQGRFQSVAQAMIALPLVLPPTVLGFYLLVLFSPQSSLGQLWFTLSGEQLAFSFSGLLIGSIIYSLPFTLQPLINGFKQYHQSYQDVATSLGFTFIHQFLNVILPMCKPAIITAAALTFAHTMGEFGVVLMIGGNIPTETQVISIALYEHVELLDYQSAHKLSLILLVFSMIWLTVLYRFNRQNYSWA